MEVENEVSEVDVETNDTSKVVEEEPLQQVVPPSKLASSQPAPKSVPSTIEGEVVLVEQRKKQSYGIPTYLQFKSTDTAIENLSFFPVSSTTPAPGNKLFQALCNYMSADPAHAVGVSRLISDKRRGKNKDVLRRVQLNFIYATSNLCIHWHGMHVCFTFSLNIRLQLGWLGYMFF
jgi:hypothetical protein